MSDEYSGSSRQRYRRFVRDYKQQRLDAVAEAAQAKKTALDRPASTGVEAPGGETAPKGLFPGRRREFLRVYGRWLWPHRAAIGLTEENDAVAIVVSEERGHIALAMNGRIERALSADELRQRLATFVTERRGGGRAASAYDA